MQKTTTKHGNNFRASMGASGAKLDKKNLKRVEKLELLEDDKKKTLYDLMDTYIRDAKARKAYAT